MGAIQQLISSYGSSGGSVWTPANLTVPPSIWVNETSAITGAVQCQQWDDISGNGYHLSQSNVGNRPLINNPGLNGMRSIAGDGSDDVLINASAGVKALTQNQSAAWFMCAGSCGDTTAVLRHIWFMSTITSANARFNISMSTTSGARRPALRVRRLDADAVAVLNASTALDTNPHVLLFMMDWANGDGSIWIDGVLDAQNLSLTSSGNTSNTASASSLGLYASPIGSATDFDGGEFCFGVGALPTSGEITQLFNYFSRWT